MAKGITIGEVTNTIAEMIGTEKIPISSGGDEPQVVTTGILKEYINDDEEITLAEIEHLLT